MTLNGITNPPVTICTDVSPGTEFCFTHDMFSAIDPDIPAAVVTDIAYADGFNIVQSGQVFVNVIHEIAFTPVGNNIIVGSSEIAKCNPDDNNTFVIQTGECPPRFLIVEQHIPPGAPSAPLSGMTEVLRTRNFVSVYPNPSKSSFSISLDNLAPGIDQRVEIYDMLGRIVFKQPLQGKIDALEINCSEWVKGLYILRVYNNGEIVTTEKISVKE